MYSEHGEIMFPPLVTSTETLERAGFGFGSINLLVLGVYLESV